MIIDTFDCQDDWLCARCRSIGSSDAAAVLGISGFKSPFLLWAEKTGRAEPPDLSTNRAIKVGKALESLVIEEFAIETGRKITPWAQLSVARDEVRQWLTATPDAIQTRDDGSHGILEAKTVGIDSQADWEDGPPLYYQVQAQHQLHILGLEWGSICALFLARRTLVYFDIMADHTYWAAALKVYDQFWQQVTSETPPPVDGSQATRDILKRMYPSDDGETIELPAASSDWAAELSAAKEAEKAAKERRLEAENAIVAALGNATFGITADGRVFSYKTQSRAGYYVEPTEFRVLREVKRRA